MSNDALQKQADRAAPSPDSERQFEKLAQAISRSQQNYRDLIDSLDQALFTISLRGEIRVANLQMSEILGASFQEIIGRPLTDFLVSPTPADAQRLLPALLEKGTWTGIVPVTLKKDNEFRHFSCWFQTLVEHGEVAAITGWARDVTAQHEAEKRFAELFESLREGIIFVTPEGRLLDANPALVRMLGYDTKANLQAINFRDVYDDPTDRDEIIREVEEKGSFHGREVVLRRKDGKRIHCLSSGFAIRDASGRAVRLQGTIVDITERLEIEKRLRQEQEFSRRLIANFPDLIAVLDVQGKFTYISDQVQKILGRSPQEYLGGEFGVRANPEDKVKIDAMCQRVIRGEVPRAQVEFRAPHTDGTWRVLLVTAGPLFDEDGKISGVVTSARDVTEHHEIERRLHQEQEFVRRLIECFPDLIVVLDPEGRFKFVSERIRDILGVSPEDYIGQPVGQRMSPEDQSKLAEMLQEAVSGRKPRQIEIRAQHIDGAWKTLRITASPFFDEKGKIAGMVSSGRDVTESKQFEQQLAQSEKFAAMGQMMAGAAHELNNPLTAILGISDLLRERATDETTRRQVDLILQQARRAAGIVLNLLAFSRPSAHGQAKIDLKAVVQEALQAESALLAQRNIRIKFDASEGVLFVEGNRRLLTQVFSNLIANAEQSISAARGVGGGTLSISISSLDGCIRVSFADDGPGIAPEIVGKIFDPFFTTKRPGGGSGLGLTIALAVIKEHGGSIEVQSTPGSGATFDVMLPPCAQAASDPALPSSPIVESPPSDAEILQGHTVLIVDDEESIREILGEDLSRRGMKIHAVESSEAALGYLSTSECEIVLCDFNLPGISGEALFEKLLATGNKTTPRFIFMTGDLVDPALVSRYRKKGARILQKPFSVAMLATLLAEFLQKAPLPAD